MSFEIIDQEKVLKFDFQMKSDFKSLNLNRSYVKIIKQ